MALSTVLVNSLVKALSKDFAEKFSLEEADVSAFLKEELTSHFAGSGKGKGKAQKAEKGKGRVSGFLLFSSDMRPKLQSEGEVSFGELGKMLGKKWKELDSDEKAQWNEKAKQKNEENGITTGKQKTPAQPKVEKSVTKATTQKGRAKKVVKDDDDEEE